MRLKKINFTGYEWPSDEEGEKALKAVKASLPCPKCLRKDCRCPKDSPRRRIN